jgi:ferredoxin, 2Fe-2S
MMGKVIAIDRDGEAHELEAEPGLSLMEILRDGGLPIEAICGGQCICSTCHVYIDPAWADALPPRRDAEQVLVEDSGHYRKNSRLGCQVDFTRELDGLKLVLAPEF